MEAVLGLKVAVIGLGLIGGSLALALKQHTCCTVIGYDQCAKTMASAEASGAVDVVASSMEEAVAGADVIVYAINPSLIGDAVRQTAAVMKTGAVVTDVASAKGDMADKLAVLLPNGVCYIGGHPMAGSEQAGFAAAHAELFRGRPYILLNHDPESKAAIGRLEALVSQIGAKAVVMDASMHDPAVAAISHVPHITAAALCIAAGEGDQGALNLTLAAGGFCDMTRVASSNPVMWADICCTNRDAVSGAIDHLQHVLDQVRELLAQDDQQGLAAFFGKAKAIRDGAQHHFDLTGGGRR